MHPHPILLLSFVQICGLSNFKDFMSTKLRVLNDRFNPEVDEGFTDIKKQSLKIEFEFVKALLRSLQNLTGPPSVSSLDDLQVVSPLHTICSSKRLLFYLALYVMGCRNFSGKI